MATCGNCHTTSVTVEHVKACYAGAGTVLTVEAPPVSEFVQNYMERHEQLTSKFRPYSDYKPMALTVSVPDSKYALEREAGLVFYEIRTGRNGKWAGFKFIDRIVGAPGDWKRYAIKGAARSNILAEIQADPKTAAVRFSRNFTVCAVCSSPLSDAESMARGLGPVCASKF